MIKCNDISYRQGFIEVAAGIHPHHVNVEVWNVHPDRDISGLSLGDQAIADNEIIGNTEIELSVAQASALIEALRNAIQLAGQGEA
ncbi:hypothetical protein [Methylibium rhizosphaerae]|uniref:hypothetical protein n=1 Tax=Methylibium rhizosphaerae TaxID=2570323 RepID=UPI001127C628|nr:hypothetical protein [Methylibium rhizosphaerae]